MNEAAAPQPDTPALMAALVVAIAERADREAFARLFAFFAPRVKGFLMRRGANASLAEEIAQEAMLSVWRKAAHFQPERGTASTWVFTIARNLAVDRLRRDGPPPGAEAQPAEEDAVESAETAMLSAEREQRLRAALATLSPEQNTILQLSFFQDRPHSEVAAELGIPLGTVKSRIRLAIARLRLLLDDLS
ncbi:RNA polymerase sigma factor [Labrys miyagiensis]|uniref:RNA polymerase sigma factor n=1 Tax=Labrys miyagiensis TaxID=346912 RepID=A0ABQ6CH90_9HYPH|nr:sigma-70 family RNA polymerase sigma factor [Labrys miyagiensis]GLS18220.1 RNA polymerase sigma factor [Labrys miyagiensis]